MKLLHDVSASAMPVMVFTGNNGIVQIHTRPLKNIVEIPRVEPRHGPGV